MVTMWPGSKLFYKKVLSVNARYISTNLQFDNAIKSNINNYYKEAKSKKVDSNVKPVVRDSPVLFKEIKDPKSVPLTRQRNSLLFGELENIRFGEINCNLMNRTPKKWMGNVRHISSTVQLECVTKNPNENTYYKKQGKKQIYTNTRPADWDSALPYDQIPGPRPIPILGNVHRFILWDLKNINFHSAIKRLHEEYGNIVALKRIPGRKDILSLMDPTDVEKVFRNEGIFPDRSLVPSFDEYRLHFRKEKYATFPGIISMNGEEWFNVRNKLNPILLPPRTVMNYAQPMDDIALDMVEIIKKLGRRNNLHEMPEDFDLYIQKFALETMAFITFNQRIGSLSDQPDELTKNFIDNANALFETLFTLDYELMGYFYKKFHLKPWKDFVAQMDFLEMAGKQFIARAKALLRDNDPTKAPIGVFENLLKFDEHFAVTITIDLLFGGVETTAKSIGITLYLLAKNKEVQGKLYMELKNLLPSPKSPVTKEILNEASYLKAVIKESMRLLPSTVGNMRVTVKDMVLAGYKIPKGVSILANNGLMSVNENNYKRPMEFIPERWLKSTTGELSYKNTNPFVTIPFSFGPRSCAGKRFALLDLEIFFAKIIRNFDVDWTHSDMTFKSHLTFGCADPLKFRMIPRQD